MDGQVEILVGPPRGGKSLRLRANYLAALQNRTPGTLEAECLWLAPDRRTAGKALEQIAALSERAILQPQVLTFADLAEATIRAADVRIAALSSLQQRHLLRRSIDSAAASKQLRHYGRIAASPGFLNFVVQFIAELKRSDVWSEQYAGRPLDRAGRDLAAIYSHYERTLTAGRMYDAEGRIWLARELISQHSASATNLRLVVVDGFSTFTAAEYDIVSLLAARSAALKISLAMERDAEAAGRSSLFARTRHTLGKLRQRLPGCRIEWVAPAAQDGGCLLHLRQNIYRPPSEMQKFTGRTEAIEIVAAGSEQGEIVEIARRVKRLLAEGAAKPGEVVVVFRQLRDVSRRIAEVFDDFGIPVYLEARAALEESPLMRWLVGLLRLAIEDWPYRRVLRTLAHSFIAQYFIGDTAELVATERAVRRAQIALGREALLGALARRAGQGAELASNEEAEAAVAGELLGRLAELLDRLPASASLAQWSEHLESLLTGLGTLEDGEGARDWRLVQRGLSELAEAQQWLGDEPASYSLDNLVQQLEVLGQSMRVTFIGDEVGKVRVLSAEAGRHVAAGHLFLGGLSEQAFAGLATTGEETDVGESAGEALESTSAYDEAMYLFYELVCQAEKSLTLSYPSLDAKGQSLPPSPLLTELERCFPAKSLPHSEAVLGQLVPLEPVPRSRSDLRRLIIGRDTKSSAKWLAGMLTGPTTQSVGEAIAAGLECVAERGRREEFGPFEGLLQSPAAAARLAERFGPDCLWSPSQLERYATCPFRFFGETLLGLEPLEDLTLQNDPARRGSLLHQVLATIHEQILAAGEDIDVAATELAERFARALEQAIARRPLEGLPRALREIERREVLAWAEQYTEQEASYRKQWKNLDVPPRPALFEVRFGSPARDDAAAEASSASTALPFVLDLGDQQIRLTGQIDRVDVGGHAGVTLFNIIDYKSGRGVKLQSEQVVAGRQLQLPLYALAAEQLLLAEQNAQALSAGYWNVQGGGFDAKKGAISVRQTAESSVEFTGSWLAMQPEIVERVRSLVAGIRGGDFPVYNDDTHCTRYCPLRTVCRIGQIRSLQKTWPPAAESQS